MLPAFKDTIMKILTFLEALLVASAPLVVADYGGDYEVNMNYYAVHMNTGVPPVVPNLTIPSTSSTTRCAAHCKETIPQCAAFSMSGSLCGLFGLEADSTVVLTETNGTTLYIIMTYSLAVVGSLENLPDQNTGGGNVFPSLIVSKSGTLVRWTVRCVYSGVVFMAVWRPLEELHMYKLIARTRIEILSGTERLLTMFDVPEDGKFQVAKGDILGFHYEKPSTRANVITEDSPVSHPGLSESDLGPILKHSYYDSELMDGDEKSMSLLSNTRLPAIGAYIK